jgi:hypothetical protein
LKKTIFGSFYLARRVNHPDLLNNSMSFISRSEILSMRLAFGASEWRRVWCYSAVQSEHGEIEARAASSRRQASVNVEENRIETRDLAGFSS